jgi:hypothetical protein
MRRGKGRKRGLVIISNHLHLYLWMLLPAGVHTSAEYTIYQAFCLTVSQGRLMAAV